ncbi:MAG TPA: hypothetical protein VI636_05715 [Candidatus Angelobacter sp.]
MIIRPFRRLILYWFLLSGASLAQSFLFVSPNTRDHLSDEDAAGSLNSFEQSNFLAVAKYLGKKVCGAPHIFSAEGIYDGAAENSSLLTGCKNSQAQYLGALLGRYAHQKQILVFDPSPLPESKERLLMVEFTTDHPADTVKHLRQYPISGATVLFQGQVIQVYIWAVDHAEDAAVHRLADAEHATLREIPGKGTMIGDELSRVVAQHAFDQRIAAYERAHHRSLSRLLGSKQLHDMLDQPASEVPR